MSTTTPSDPDATSTPDSETLVDQICNLSHQLVRELESLHTTFADTDYSARAVHCLIELGGGDKNEGQVWTAARLARVLNLDGQKSRNVVEAAIGELVDGGDVVVLDGDGGKRAYRLTLKGYQTLAAVNSAVRSRVAAALGGVSTRDGEAVLYGLRTYTAALRDGRGDGSEVDIETETDVNTGEAATTNVTNSGPVAVSTTSASTPAFRDNKIQIVRGYRPGILARTLQMHMDYYSRAGFGIQFETLFSKSVADIVTRLADEQTEAWLAVLSPPPSSSDPLTSEDQNRRAIAQGGDRIVGTVYVDGHGADSKTAMLRAFIVDADFQRCGIGGRLLSEALAFIDERGFEETELWTVKGSDVATRMYEKVGFVLVEEKEGAKWWEVQVVQQHFVRKGKGVAIESSNDTVERSVGGENDEKKPE